VNVGGGVVGGLKVPPGGGVDGGPEVPPGEVGPGLGVGPPVGGKGVGNKVGPGRDVGTGVGPGAAVGGGAVGRLLMSNTGKLKLAKASGVPVVESTPAPASVASTGRLLALPLGADIDGVAEGLSMTTTYMPTLKSTKPPNASAMPAVASPDCVSPTAVITARAGKVAGKPATAIKRPPTVTK